MIDTEKLFTLGFNSRTTNIRKRTITNRDFIAMYLTLSGVPCTRREVLTALYRFRGFEDIEEKLRANYLSSYLTTSRYGGHAGEEMHQDDRSEWTGFFDSPNHEKGYKRELLWFRAGRNLYAPTLKGLRHASRIIAALGLDQE